MVNLYAKRKGNEARDENLRKRDYELAEELRSFRGGTIEQPASIAASFLDSINDLQNGRRPFFTPDKLCEKHSEVLGDAFENKSFPFLGRRNNGLTRVQEVNLFIIRDVGGTK
jgi:hypothetical protein